MMAIEQQGMFGMSPEELQYTLAQQQQQQDMKNAMEFGRGSLGQQIATGGYLGGAGIGRGLMQLGQGLGYIPQDPRLAEAQKMMEIKQRLMQQDINPEDIDSFYPALIRELSKGGMLEKAAAFQKEYQALSGKIAEQKIREAIANTQALTAAELAAKRRADAEKAAAQQRAIAGRASVVRKKNSDLTEEEALGIAEDASAFRSYMETPKIKTKVETIGNERVLLNLESGEVIKVLGPAERSLGQGLSDLASGLVAGKKEAEAAGTAVGKEGADIQNRYDALDSLAEATKLLNNGIYAGFYGPAQEFVSAATKGVLGDSKRLTNTQQFRSFIGEVVIPRLKDFGGSDTVEELKYLRSVLAGDTKLEPGAIKGILASAETKIRNRITRLQQQQRSIRSGEQLPVGPLKTRTIQRKLPSGIVVEEVVEE